MIARFFLFLTLLVGINIWFLFQVIGMVTPAQGSSQSVASVLEMHGTVMMRPAAQAEWRPVRFNTMLKVGDVVYVGDESKLVYTYKREKANITMPSNSIFEITRTPSISSKVFRTFYKTKTIGERKLAKGEKAKLRKKRIYVRMEQSPSENKGAQEKKEEKGDNKEQDGGGAAAFTFERQAKAIRILEPLGDLNIVSNYGVVSFPVRLEKPAETKKLFGYLWKREGSPRPMWTGVVEGNRFEEVVIPAPGDYVFQVVSEDDEYISPLINVTLSSSQDVNAADVIGKQFVAEKWEGKRVLVLR